MRTPLIVANWKMNHNVEDSLMFVAQIRNELILNQKREIVICPAHTNLYSLSIALQEKVMIKLGAQNCYFEDAGAFTGEISPAFLKELDCKYVIVGHSERRQIFNETDEIIHKKVKAVLDHNMTPILCIGETLDQRNNNETIKVITAQLNKDLKDIDKESLSQIVIAYEPIWAIGTGLNATPEQAQEVHSAIRHWLLDQANKEIGDKIRILYGGSVKPDNAHDLMKQPDIDGTLVGGASLNVDSFLQIVNYGL